MRNRFIFPFLLALLTGPALAVDGMVKVLSQHDVATTESRLVAILESKGMKVFARVPHSDGAAGVGIELRPTKLVIFGNPKVGAPLMQCQQSVAIDLPQKMLIWEDEEGQTWLSYNDPAYLQARHDIKGCDPVLETITKALAGISAAAGAAE